MLILAFLAEQTPIFLTIILNGLIYMSTAEEISFNCLIFVLIDHLILDFSQYGLLFT